MESIRILSPELELIAEIDDYEYLSFTRSFFNVGSFELHINNNKQNVQYLQKKNIILVGTHNKRVGIIQHREIGFNDEGKKSETWVITGGTLDAITKQRLAVPPTGETYDSIEGKGETAIKHYFNNHLVNPADPNRKVPMLDIKPDQKRGKDISYHTRFEELDKVINQVAFHSETGFEIEIDFDKRRWILECYEGTDRSGIQNKYAPIIFSTDFETVKEGIFTDSDLDYVSSVYAGGIGEGKDRLISHVDNGNTGLNRFEKFIDTPDTEHLISLEKMGQNMIENHALDVTYDAELLTHNTPFVFEKDWFLGDIVTVQHQEWNIQMHTRITEVTEIFEPAGYKLEVTFGKTRPTFIEKIKEELKVPLTEKSEGGGGSNVTATSQLTNDSGFITFDEVPKKTSELSNDTGYVTSTKVSTDYVPKQRVVETGTNVNTVTESGFYRLHSGLVNIPTAVEWGQMIVSRAGGDTIFQMASDFNGGMLIFRNGNPSNTGGTGTWSEWRTVYHSGNDAAFANNMSEKMSRLNSVDNRAGVPSPSSYARGMYLEFKYCSTVGLPSSAGEYCMLQTMGQWMDDSGGGVHQTAYAQDGNVYHRYGLKSTGFGAWRRISMTAV